MFKFSQNLLRSQIIPSALVKKTNIIFYNFNFYNKNENKKEKSILTSLQ